MNALLLPLWMMLLLSLSHWTITERVAEVDDIVIEYLNETITCDEMICPPKSLACRVTKRNVPEDYTKVVRTRKCYAVNGAIVSFQSEIEKNKYPSDVNITIIAGGGSKSYVAQMMPNERDDYKMAVWSLKPGLIKDLEDAADYMHPLSTTTTTTASGTEELSSSPANDSSNGNPDNDIEFI